MNKNIEMFLVQIHHCPSSKQMQIIVIFVVMWIMYEKMIGLLSNQKNIHDSQKTTLNKNWTLLMYLIVARFSTLNCTKN